MDHNKLSEILYKLRDRVKSNVKTILAILVDIHVYVI